jgi:hypothetical protein
LVYDKPTRRVYDDEGASSFPMSFCSTSLRTSIHRNRPEEEEEAIASAYIHYAIQNMTNR